MLTLQSNWKMLPLISRLNLLTSIGVLRWMTDEELLKVSTVSTTTNLKSQQIEQSANPHYTLRRASVGGCPGEAGLGIPQSQGHPQFGDPALYTGHQ